MHSCRDMGIPTVASSFAFFQSMRRFWRRKVKIKRLWLRYRMAAIMLTAWEPMEHSGCEDKCGCGKDGEGGADCFLNVLFCLHAGVFSHQDGASQGEAGNHAGDDLCDLGAC